MNLSWRRSIQSWCWYGMRTVGVQMWDLASRVAFAWRGTACRRIGVEADRWEQWWLSRLSCKEKKKKPVTYAGECYRAYADRWCVYVRADTDEYKEKNKKELRHWADGGRGVRMRCVRTSMKVKKRKRKETYLRFGSVDGDALRVDGLACGWPCVRMTLHADGLACGRGWWWL